MFDKRALVKKYNYLIGTKKSISIKLNVEAKHKDLIGIKENSSTKVNHVQN